MNARITGKNLALAFGQTRALDGVDVEVQPGEVLAVMGPSGSGKSTLLHVLAGILKPDSGEVTYNGQRLDKMSSRNRDAVRLSEFGFVFQFGDLIPELSLAENVALPLLMTGMRRKRSMRRAIEMLERLEIADVADHSAAQASGGQVQRAAVARALINRPAVVFADEPTGALDTVTGELVLNALVDLAREHDSSVVLVTHAVDVAAVSDREIIIRDGRIASSKQYRSLNALQQVR
ncbi:MAG TPA: ABC transporter ATP-binding protein [Actinomycetales bacterium]|nr:ABC transporter ATP-binding protein [Actinomycetales bacterium]